MATEQTPTPGNWFTNLSGQNICVWGLVFDNTQPAKIVLRYQSGVRKIISRTDWDKLDLIARPLPPLDIESMSSH